MHTHDIQEKRTALAHGKYFGSLHTGVAYPLSILLIGNGPTNSVVDPQHDQILGRLDFVVSNALAFIGEPVVNTASAVVKEVGDANRHAMVRGGNFALANGKVSPRVLIF